MAGSYHCNGLCAKYKVTHRSPGGLAYWGNVKRCNSCEVRVMWDGNFCPCCRARLRSKPVCQNAAKRRRDETVKRI